MLRSLLLSLLAAGAAAQGATPNTGTTPGSTGGPSLGSGPPAAEAASFNLESLRTAALETTQTAVDRGLDWLAAQQSDAGGWIGHVGHKQGDRYYVTRSASQQREANQGHLGMSSLCGMAFLAGGHVPGRGKHGKTVQRALDYVIRNVREDGFVTDAGSRMYSHAFATLFLAELHGMVPGNRTKKALEDAVRWIVDNQNSLGAWRYNPFTTQADLSVTVCQLQALRAARNIGIRVPKATIDSAVNYVMRSRDRQGLFYYKIAGRGAWRKNRQYAINSAGLTALLSAGIYDRELQDPVLRWLGGEYADVADYYSTHFYYWYGNYYASQAFFQAGDAWFKPYYQRIRSDLLRAQEADGRWRNSMGPGDPFGTAVACIVLAIPFQYLPIFQR